LLENSFQTAEKIVQIQSRCIHKQILVFRALLGSENGSFGTTNNTR
jgi:hypothetical protein